MADFGLSRKIAEVSLNKFGIKPYVDPKCFSDQCKNYKLNVKSDVYSIGVLMWQISSGCIPFREVNDDQMLSLAIFNGKREETVIGTPIEYSNLYKGK